MKFSKQENGGGALCGAPIGQAAASLGAPGRLRFWRTSTFSPWNGTRSCRPTLPSLLATKVNSHRAVSPPLCRRAAVGHLTACGRRAEGLDCGGGGSFAPRHSARRLARAWPGASRQRGLAARRGRRRSAATQRRGCGVPAWVANCARRPQICGGLTTRKAVCADAPRCERSQILRGAPCARLAASPASRPAPPRGRATRRKGGSRFWPWGLPPFRGWAARTGGASFARGMGPLLVVLRCVFPATAPIGVILFCGV